MEDYRRIGDGASVSITLYRVSTTIGFARLWSRLTTMSVVRQLPTGGPSGLPIGLNSTYMRKASGGYCIAIDDEFAIKCSLSRAGSGTLGAITYHSSNPDGDFELIEGAVRHALARLAGRSLPGGPPRTVNGVEIRDTLRTTSGRHLVSLRRWAGARGLAMNTNAVLGTCSVAIGQRQLIFPLAASKVKFGPTWHDLPSAICRKGSEWYVDLDALEAIL